MTKIIDVSRWQQVIDWHTVSKNVNGAMIKVGGSDDGFYIDSFAQRNLIEARSNKLPVGQYYFLGGVHSSIEEASHIKQVFNVLGGLKAGEPFALDWERRRAGLDEVSYIVGIVEQLIRSGFPKPLIYMNYNYLTTNDWSRLVQLGCGLWIASWGDNDNIPEPHEVPKPNEWPFWALWQYSSTANVPGIYGRVDHNLFNGTMDAFKAYGLGGDMRILGNPLPVVQPPVYTHAQYTVKPGDTLSKIASYYKKTWQELYAMNRDIISNPNRIYPNQKLRVWVSKLNAPLPTATHPANPIIRFHTVKNGENLSVIASKYNLSSWTTLYDLNKAVIGANPHLIKPGQVLRVP